jgi:hypothetical protein
MVILGCPKKNEMLNLKEGAFCPKCQKIVFDAQVMLSDDAALSALERNDSVPVVHHPQIPDGTASGTTDEHHITLTGPERDKLRRQLKEHMRR